MYGDGEMSPYASSVNVPGGGENLASSHKGGVAKLAVAAIVLAATALPMSATTASAHLPSFDTGGESYDTAEIIDNLDTSYAFYGQIPAMVPGSSAGAKYYVFEGMSGQELYSYALKERPELAERFIFVTGDVVTPGTGDFIEHAGRPSLSKPFTSAEMIAVLKKLLEKDRR